MADGRVGVQQVRLSITTIRKGLNEKYPSSKEVTTKHRRRQQQLRNLGNIICYLDNFNPSGSLYTPGAGKPRAALQSELPEVKPPSIMVQPSRGLQAIERPHHPLTASVGRHQLA